MLPRRILVVSDEMEIGGSQRQIAQLLGGLSREHWRPELLFFRERSFLVDEIEAGGVPCHHLPKRGRFDARFVLSVAVAAACPAFSRAFLAASSALSACSRTFAALW